MPPVSRDQSPPAYRPFKFHGVEFAEAGDSQARGTCPFCDKQKFYVEPEEGLWDCKACGERGNPYTFLARLAETSGPAPAGLLEDRGLLDPKTLEAWGVRSRGGSVTLAGYNTAGKLNQLYRYAALSGGKKALLATPEMKHAVHSADLARIAKASTVFVAEGPWDGAVLWETLGFMKEAEAGKYALTGNPKLSLLKDWAVVATPGCNVFPEAWCGLLAGKRVVLMYDSDHPKEHPAGSGKFSQAGYDGMRRVVEALSVADVPPADVRILSWGKGGYDKDLPSGYDVRDAVAGPGRANTRQERLNAVAGLLGALEPAPAEWVSGRTASGKSKGKPELEPLECKSWAKLRAAWQKALKWTEGLDRGLSVMLASIISTETNGDQLWVKIIGPASCLAGETPILDPTDGTTATVKDRREKGEKFFVYGMRPDGDLGVFQAMPPQVFDAQPMFRVTLSSGRSMRVTGGHRFWTQEGYASLHAIACDPRGLAAYRLPTIGEGSLSSRVEGALRSTRTAEGCRCGCCFGPRLCGEQLRGASGSDRRGPQQRVDAQELDQTPLRLGDSGGEGKRTCRPSLIHHLSRSSALPPGVSPQCGGGCGPLGDEGTCEAPRCWCTCTEPSHLGSDRTRKPEPSCRLSLQSTGRSGAQTQPPEGTGRPFPPSPAGPCSTRSPATPPGKGRSPLGGGPGSAGASVPAASEPRRAAGTSEPQGSQPRGPHSTQRSSCPTRKGRRPDGGDLRTTQQPCWTPLSRVSLSLGRHSLPEFDTIVSVEPDGAEPYYDFHVPETNNYWCEGVISHNTGKSTLAEAVAVSKTYVSAKSTIRGFHSGYQTDKDGTDDNSLINTLNNKTLVTKDGDTLLQSPNVSQILSEARDVYDRTSRTHYRNKMSKDYVGVNMTWILCGTASLRALDSSELGERFLDCVIMEGIDAEMEKEINWRQINSVRAAFKSYGESEKGGTVDGQNEAMANARRLTGGYIEHLRRNDRRILGGIEMDDEAARLVVDLGAFVAHLRARPSVKQEEEVTREFSTRLVGQLARMAVCLAGVLGKDAVDAEVLRRVKRIALDTARGRTLKIVECLYGDPDGADVASVVARTPETTEKARGLLRFLKGVGAVDLALVSGVGMSKKYKWYLTDEMRRLYGRVLGGGS